MSRTSIPAINAVLMLLLAAAVALVYALSGRLVIAIFTGLALTSVFALLVRWRMRVEIRKVNRLVEALPAFEPASPVPAGSAFERTPGVVESASQRLLGQLDAAGNERRQLEALLDSMQDAVVAVDAAGRIQWTNTRMQKLLPVSYAGPVRVGHALVQTVRDPEVLECVRLALEHRTVQVRRSTSVVPGRIFEVNASPMPTGGAVAVLHDITRIEEVEAVQRDFVANVSHELRTPLTSITGYVETLLDHEALSPQAREFLETILKNATRMNRLTEDLLVMARVERPAADLNPAPVPADVLVRDAVRAMSGLVQENEASLELGHVTQCQVFADTDAVMQVLGNLIENAIKYGQPRGHTRVEPASHTHARVVLSAREVAEPYEAVEFSVQDFGAGIASEHLGRIFERFYRVDKTRSRESGGTGLGLAIARHMVQTQGGTIWAESELGAGSRFVFTLPKALYPVPLER